MGLGLGLGVGVGVGLPEESEERERGQMDGPPWGVIQSGGHPGSRSATFRSLRLRETAASGGFPRVGAGRSEAA